VLLSGRCSLIKEDANTVAIMKKAKKRLYILCDVEGASGISKANWEAMSHGSDLWRSEGRALITSDVRAVCEAANEFGVDEIIIEDEHDGGKRLSNLLVTNLPANARVLRRPHLPGKARKAVRGEPYGMIFVGQHAMAGGGGFAPHTVAPHIGAVTLNGVRVGEIGLELAKFMGARLLAVVGEEAAIAEAKALCPRVVGIPVKSLEKDWFPPADETHEAIRRRILEALRSRDRATGLRLESPFRFTMTPADGYVFDPDKKMPLRWLVRLMLRWGKGQLTASEASWETKTITGGVWMLQFARLFLRKRAVA
jgi:D-aminopeptidase